MATLTRQKSRTSLLDTQIPAPFPRDEFDQLAVEDGVGQGVETPNTAVALKSIMDVQKTCLLTLNNLLSAAVEETMSPESFRELRTRVDSISPSLSQTDAALAHALVNLIKNLSVFSDFQSSIPSHPPPPQPIDLFDALSRQLSDLQLERLSTQPTTTTTTFPERGLEASLLWSHIDADLENVVALCNQRIVPKDHPPPQYDIGDYDHLEEEEGESESLPEYEVAGALDSPKTASFSFQSQAAAAAIRSGDDKVRMDLEAVAMAIERLYIAAPQLHNQRVELKSSKLAELERARVEASTTTTTRTASSSSLAAAVAKVKNDQVEELEKIVDLIGKASERRLCDQSVILDGANNMLERAKRKESAKRDAFVEQLFHHSDVGRLHDQDAVFLQQQQQVKQKDPEALLTLPEFIREPLPVVSSEKRKRKTYNEATATTMLSLPEFVRVDDEDDDDDDEEDIDDGDDDSDKPARTRTRNCSKAGSTMKHRKRSRSLSAPPFAWLRSSASKVVNGHHHPHHHCDDDSKGKTKTNSQGFDVIYVAENHENLHHILVFFQIMGGGRGGATTPPMPTQQRSTDVQAEIIPLFLNLATTANVNGVNDVVSGGGGEDLHHHHHRHLLIKSGPHSSLPLMLPGHTTNSSGKQDVRVLSGHYEIKLSTAAVRSPPPGTTTTTTTVESVSTTATTTTTMTAAAAAPPPLLDATHLSTLKPTSFVCSSCSLPLISSKKGVDFNNNNDFTYRDLPSEHWEELVEAWMCHADQKFAASSAMVAKGSSRKQRGGKGRGGFWPKAGEALVGGSYVLFEEGAMNLVNLLVADEKKHDDWHLVRCLCGAIIGRCQEREVSDHHDNATATAATTKVYRVLKYAVRPVRPNSDPLKIPLSAFVVEDMMEYVHAHASYRFVISDEDEEKPRILIWLFKPKMRLSYTASRHHVIAKSANILAAKVLFKLLGPDERDNADIQTILNKYPGFPQAEYLSYPMSACRHIATALRDSNSAYPEGLRMMTGLEVGWLQRM